MKTTLMIATVLAAGASAVYAQDPVVTQPPAAASAAAPVPPKSTLSSSERVSEVKVLEGVFVQAMNQGAADLVHQMQVIDPGSVANAMISQAHARGISLEGYGVFFDVDVPLMNMSLIVTQRQALVADLRAKIDEATRLRAHATSPDVQQQLDARVQMLTSILFNIAPQVAPAAESRVTAVTNNLEQPRAGSVIAATTDVAPVAPLETRNADQMYSDAIKTALMNAMVNHSSALMLGDDESLTVAARDNGPTIPGAIADRSGVILTIKGSDLAAFRANKLSRDEVVKKIEIKEWR
jgi:hypothetical protein